MRPTDCCLSIIIPCYNSERFIKNTITMFETQDIKDCEIIIVDDGSQDDTLAITKKLEKEYDNIFVISKKNEGASSARNEGLKYAKGRYVIFFDSDDKIEENTLKYYKRIFQQHSECEIYAFGYQMSRNGKVIRKYVTRRHKEFVLSGSRVLEEIFYGRMYVHICACVFKKSFLKRYNLLFAEGVAIGEDQDYIRRCLVKAQKIYYNERISFTYQLRPESQTEGNTYTLKTFQSLEFTLKSINYIRGSVSVYACNFFAASRYVNQILNYLKSDLKSAEIESEFRNYRYLVYQKMHMGNLRWTSAIIFIGLIPLELLFGIFK